jgi:hypothetical protein
MKKPTHKVKTIENRAFGFTDGERLMPGPMKRKGFKGFIVAFPVCALKSQALKYRKLRWPDNKNIKVIPVEITFKI